MYVYISPSLTNDENHLRTIRRVQQRIETGDPLLFGLLFSPRHPHWIKRIQNYRLIAALQIIEQERILCLTHLLPRGDREYRRFLDNTEQWGRDNIRLDETMLRSLPKSTTQQAIRGNRRIAASVVFDL